jgi:hypothetical protein
MRVWFAPMWKGRLTEISVHPRLARAIWWSTVVLLAVYHLFLARGIGTSELWLDESSTWNVAHRPLLSVLSLPTAFHSQPPLYYLVLHVLMKVSDARLFLRGWSWLCVLGLLQYVLLCVDELSLLSRAFFCLLFLSSALPGYLSTALRPYGMAALTTFVSTILFLRMLREPTKKAAIRYGVAALVMLYTMAFDVWVIVIHGACWTAHLAFQTVTEGPRAVWTRRRASVLAMPAIAVGYLPYLWMAVHFQYQKNASADLSYALQSGHQFFIANEFFAFAPSVMTGLYAFIVLGLWGELRARRFSSLVWIGIAVGQVAFVVYFMYGRNAIGPTGRYMTPAFPAVCMLAALGFEQLSARPARLVWQLVPLLLLYLVWPLYVPFRAYLKDPSPIGEWGRLRRAILGRPGDAAVFFDVGYGGQDFQYVVRHDPRIRTFTMPGERGNAGGDNHLDPEYILRSIAETHETVRCYYYQVIRGDGVYARTFVPEMRRLGYSEDAPHGAVRSYCLPTEP